MTPSFMPNFVSIAEGDHPSGANLHQKLQILNDLGELSPHFYTYNGEM